VETVSTRAQRNVVLEKDLRGNPRLFFAAVGLIGKEPFVPVALNIDNGTPAIGFCVSVNFWEGSFSFV
jgi:hypothetical protein